MNTRHHVWSMLLLMLAMLYLSQCDACMLQCHLCSAQPCLCSMLGHVATCTLRHDTCERCHEVWCQSKEALDRHTFCCFLTILKDGLGQSGIGLAAWD